METVYVTQDSSIVRDQNTILIKTDSQKIRLPYENLAHIVCMTDGTISTKLISLCGKAGIRVSFFDYYGWFVGAFEPINSNKSGCVALRQANLLQTDKGINIGKKLIVGAVENQRLNLKYHQYRGNDKLSHSISTLENQIYRIENSKNRQEIMGNEGLAKRTYYECWKLIDPNLDFGVRKKRPPNNIINCLISFINSMVYSAVRHEIAKTHLNETLSFLHAPSQSRSSLSLDVSEPFKPIITDLIIWKLIRKGEIDESYFEYPACNICLLSPAGKKKIIGEFSRLVEGQDGLRIKIRELSMEIERFTLGLQDDIKVYVRKI